MAAANGDAAVSDQPTSQDGDDSAAFKLKFCTVCASNQNRYVTDRNSYQSNFPRTKGDLPAF